MLLVYLIPNQMSQYKNERRKKIEKLSLLASQKHISNDINVKYLQQEFRTLHLP